MSKDLINYFNSLNITKSEETCYWKVLLQLTKNPDIQLISFNKKETFDTYNMEFLRDENGNFYTQYLLVRDCDVINDFCINIIKIIPNYDNINEVFTTELVIANKKIILKSNQVINMVGSLYSPIYIRFTFKYLMLMEFNFKYTKYLARMDIRRNLIANDGQELVTGKIHYDSNLCAEIN